MKSFYDHMLRSKPLMSLIFCYFVISMVGLLQKLFLFSLGQGDIFYYIFDLVKNGLGVNDASFAKLLSYVMFLGSFYGIFIKAFIYVVVLFLYASVIQFIIHLFVKQPARFGNLLSIFFTTTAILYVLMFIPVAGAILFAIGFLYNVARETGKANGFSTLWGMLLLIAPKLVFLLIIFVVAFSVWNVVSLF